MMGACKLRARWWLAVAACLLVVHKVGARGPIPSLPRAQCGPRTFAVCRATDDPEVFMVNGQKHKMSYLNSITFEASCNAAKLDEVAWPFFPKSFSYSVVILRNCPPPQNYATYAAALQSLNITATDELRLLDLPSSPAVTGSSLQSSPPSLMLAAPKGKTVVLPPHALVRLEDLRSLTLVGVDIDRLPPKLVNLTVNGTGVQNVGPERMIQLTGKLEINIERGLDNLTLNLPHVQTLRIGSPDLFTLTILNAPLSALASGFLLGSDDLDTLVIRGLREHSSDEKNRKIPIEFLKTQGSLWKFNLTESDVVYLPRDLFSSTQNLRQIDLSKNQIKTIPNELFLGLDDLAVLNLALNHIVLPDLQFLAHLTRLTWLDLSACKIGTVCAEGGKSVLANMNLVYLDLTSTFTKHICVDWIQDMRELTYLGLVNNDITSLSCKNMNLSRIINDAGRFVIDLDVNSIKEYKCTREDYDRFAATSEFEYGELRLPQLTCDCDSYWLKRSMETRNVTVKERFTIACDRLFCNRWLPYAARGFDSKINIKP